MEKLYTSTMNYQPGKRVLEAGSAFTAEQWVDAGGTLAGLEGHVAKKYITEVAQVRPQAPVMTVAEQEEEIVELSEPVAKTLPQGIWNYTVEELEPFDLTMLNTMYKDRAQQYGINVRAYSDKEKLIKKMTSEA